MGFQSSWRHILIKGPEGSGKTALALAISNLIGYPQIKLSIYDPRIFSSLGDSKLS